MKDLTAHCDAIKGATMISPIAVKNVWNISHTTLCAWIILTYSYIIVITPLCFLRSGKFLPGQETHWLFSMIWTSPDG